jgi:glycerol-3-phosphate dehydrogenase (NAD(P)+)
MGAQYQLSRVSLKQLCDDDELRSMLMRIAVIGAGNWGTALSAVLSNRGHEVRLWAYEKEVAESIRSRHENTLFMPGVQLPENILPTTNLSEALDKADIVLTVMPSHVCRDLYRRMLPLLRPDMIFVSATKGLDLKLHLRMSEVIKEVTSPRFNPRLSVLSGPSFAREVVRGDPTTVVVASDDREAALIVQEAMSSRSLRLYTSNDVIGVELGGAIKNVIAIAAGILSGLGLGHNPAAALITRGLAEMTRLACACGGRRETLAGLAGMGDLVLTCTGDLSRNRAVGFELGKGRKLADIVGSMRMVAEGVKTAGVTVALAEKHQVEMPITQQIHRILEGEIAPHAAIRELMERTLKDE